MKVGISLLLLAITVAAVSARYRSGYDCRKYCGRKYVPVCSTEGTTYDNECMMRCDWSVKDCDGKCPCYKPPPRPIAYKGPRPIEYYRPRPNEHNGPRPIEYNRPGSIDHNGPRPIEYYRPRTIEHYEPRPIEHYEPLSTYYYEPSTPSDCNCGPDKDKVCTADGETYDNECEANCDGKVAVCDGQCPCS